MLLGASDDMWLQVHLTLPELPPGTRAMLLSMSNFGGGGFKNIKSLQVRLSRHQ